MPYPTGTEVLTHFINTAEEDLMYSAVWGRMRVLPNISRNNSTFSMELK